MRDTRLDADHQRLEDVTHIFDLVGNDLDFDPTTERWRLDENAMSVCIGRNVILPTGLRSAFRRKPIGCSIPEADRPIVDAFGETKEGLADQHMSGSYLRSCETGHYATDFSYEPGADDSNSLVVAKTNGFTTYSFLPGDRFLIRNASIPFSLRAPFVTSKIGNSNITISNRFGSFPMDFNSNLEGTIVRGRGYVQNFHFAGYTDPDGVAWRNLVKGPDEIAATGAWSSDLIGATLFLNEDGRTADGTDSPTIASVISQSTENDSILWKSTKGPLSIGNCKFFIRLQKTVDERGIWMTNGRKFWLLQGGVFQQYLDMGSDSFIGQRWRMARISSNVLMLVNGRTPPRIIRLADSPTTAAADNRTLAGLIAPIKPITVERPGVNTDYSWNMLLVTTGGSIVGSGNDTPRYRVRVRAINVIDGCESQFVQVRKFAGTVGSDDYIDVPSGTTNSINVFTVTNGSTSPPPLHERWTHIEVWRTTGAGSTYFLENVVGVAELDNEDAVSGQTDEITSLVTQFAHSTATKRVPCILADESLVGQPLLNNSDKDAGLPPPICRDVVSLDGLTLCFGSAEKAAVDPIAYARDFYGRTFTYSEPGGGVSRITLTGLFADYTFVAGDLFYLTYGGTGGAYVVLSRVSSDVIELKTVIAGASTYSGFIYGHIRRPHTIVWPRITDDEDVHYSRTDLNRPESFLRRRLRLSSRGDTFQAAVKAGRYVAVVMLEGVHLLFNDAGELRKETIAETGEGTPWPRSVIAMGSSVLWASPEGPRAMQVYNEASTDAGARGRITLLGGQRMRSWFREAYDGGMEIDAGVDTLNGCLRWRRKQDENTYQTAVYSYRTDRWTLIDDDNGLAYASSAYAGATPLMKAALHSADATGAVFELEDQLTDHPYDDATVEEVCSGEFVQHGNEIIAANRFSPFMLGEVVRFLSSDPAVDDVARIITAASSDRIAFNLVPGLTNDDAFVIGAVRQRFRFAPMHGEQRTNMKTAELQLVRLLPGPVHDSDATVELRAYRNYDDAPVATDELVAVAESGADRRIAEEYAVRAQGTAVEMEIRSRSARMDFSVETLDVTVLEEGAIVEAGA